MTQQRSTVVVFSNLEAIVQGSTRFITHVAVLQNSPSLMDGESPRWQLLGFLHDDSVQTFTLDVPSAKYELKPILDMHTALTGQDLEPMATGAVLRFEGSEAPFQLIAYDVDHAIRVDEVDADVSNILARIRTIIRRRIEQFVRAPSRAAILWGVDQAEIE